MRILKTTVISSLLTLGLSACANADIQTQEPAAAPYENLKISLEREVCFGGCSAYVVEISQDGSVDFCGNNFVEHIGAYTRKVDPQKVRDLYTQIMDADFYNLRDKYHGHVTDVPIHTIRVSVDGRHKMVVDRAGFMDDMPESVRDLQKAIDEVAEVDEWIGQGRREPSFERFDCPIQFENDKSVL